MEISPATAVAHRFPAIRQLLSMKMRCFGFSATLHDFVAGDNDQLVTHERLTAVAESLGAPHISVGKDWGLSGFGHMIPIENGSEEILKRCLDWFANAGRAGR
jgi:hypothetical protein